MDSDDAGDPSPDRERLAALLEEPFRIYCPEGHAKIYDQQGPTVHCQRCNAAYHYDELLDAKADRIPL